MLTDEDNRQVNMLLKDLTAKGVAGIDSYSSKLFGNAGNKSRLDDIVAEGQIAQRLVTVGLQVMMRDSPDIQISLDGEIAYVEVKRFHWKQQDEEDEKAMQEAGDLLAPVGNTVPTEGSEPWMQMAGVAEKKVPQYVDGQPNILVFVSDSESLQLMLESAANEYCDRLFKSCDGSQLAKLSAMILVMRTGWSRVNAHENEKLVVIPHALKPLNSRFLKILKSL